MAHPRAATTRWLETHPPVHNVDYAASVECQQIEKYHERSRTLLLSIFDKPLPRNFWNFDTRHRAALDRITSSLRTHRHYRGMIFVEADKGLGLCALDYSDYMFLAETALQATHVKLTDSPTHLIATALHDLRVRMRRHDAALPIWLCNWVNCVISGRHPKTSKCFRLLPFYRLMLKLHKPLKLYNNGSLLPKTRALTGNHVHLTQPIADFIEYHVLTFVRTLPSYIKDSDSVIRHFETTQVASDSEFFTFDVVGLYDNIPHDMCIVFLRRHLLRRGDQYAAFIADMLDFVLSHNYCTFNDEIFKQIFGFATGVSCAGSVAHIFLEELWLSCFTDPRFTFNGRYIDDGLGSFAGPRSDLRSILLNCNAQTESIEITFNLGYYHVVFLDIVFFRGPRWHATGILDTDLYEKPANTFLFFTLKSEHPSSCKRSLITGTLSRYAKRCSSAAAFYRHAADFWKRLLLRGYPPSFLRYCFKLAPSYDDRSDLLYANRRDSMSDADKRPFAFITDYSYVKSKLPLHGVLHDAAELLPPNLRRRRRLLAWRAAPKLRDLVSFRFQAPEEEVRSNFSQEVFSFNNDSSQNAIFGSTDPLCSDADDGLTAESAPSINHMS
jgi:hypothetical protein